MHSIVVAGVLALAVAAQPGAALATEGNPAAGGSGLATAVDATVVVDTPTGNGAGVAVTDELFLTAAHVVDGASGVRLRASGTPLEATVIATDAERDLAVLSSPDHGLTPVPLRQEPVQVGEAVYAAGAPLGSYVQLTAGIVSALVDDGPVTQVQTDAAINPGNSGGPLLDDEGRVVGIVVTKSGDNEGIGWAAAAEEVAGFLETAGAATPPDSVDAAETPPAPDKPIGWPLAAGAAAAALALGRAISLRRRRDRATQVYPVPPVHVYPRLDLTNDPDLAGLNTGSRGNNNDNAPSNRETPWTP